MGSVFVPTSCIWAVSASPTATLLCSSEQHLLQWPRLRSSSPRRSSCLGLSVACSMPDKPRMPGIASPLYSLARSSRKRHLIVLAVCSGLTLTLGLLYRLVSAEAQRPTCWPSSMCISPTSSFYLIPDEANVYAYAAFERSHGWPRTNAWYP
jgi:hypothetical protein